MFTIKYWIDYYNEQGTYREFIMHRPTRARALELAWVLKGKGFERVMIINTRSGKFVTMI